VPPIADRLAMVATITSFHNSLQLSIGIWIKALFSVTDYFDAPAKAPRRKAEITTNPVLL
jgi:hypothetical protein